MTIDELQYIWGSKDRSMLLKKHAAMLGAGLVLSLLGPYDTSNMPEHGLRVSYWTSLLLLASLVSGPIARLLFIEGDEKGETIWIAILKLSAVVSLPVYIVVIAYDMFLGPGGELSVDHTVNFLSNIDYGLLGYVIWYIQVIAVTLVVVGAISFAYSATAQRQQPRSARPGQRFINRLPAKLGSDLLCITVEDHYIRAYTTNGDTMILMRFSDAVSELEDYEGAQVHRSWWLAFSAIEKVFREKRRYTARLKNGMLIPVSQSHVEKLRSAGFL